MTALGNEAELEAFRQKWREEISTRNKRPTMSLPTRNKRPAMNLPATTRFHVPFRFLDLPSEIRNQIYDLASSSDTSVTLVERRKDIRCVLIETRKVDLPVFGDALRSEKSNQNRLALLRVSKQVHREAWSIFWSNMTLNLPPHDHIRDVRFDINATVIEWRYKLQLIQHLELQSLTSDFFLWVSAREVFSEVYVRQVPDWMDWMWNSDPLNFEWRYIFKAMFRLRAYLYNVRSVTIKPHYDARWSQTEMIAQVLYKLADSKTRSSMERMFPELQDIVVVNNFGAERFVKSKDGRWMRAYSKEEIPLRLSLPLWRSGPDEPSSHMVDEHTGLTAAHPVTELDPQSAMEQDFQN